jgi:acetyl esterase/lipase
MPTLTIDLSHGFEKPLAMFRELEKRWPTPGPIPEVTESTKTFNARDGAELTLYVFQSAKNNATPKAVLIFFHGGGGVMGNAYSVASIARMIVQEHDIVVVSPEYRLAPENKFPTGVNDAWDAFAHITTNVTNIAADIDLNKGLIIGGASQGAVLSSLIALHAKNEPSLPCITGLWSAAGAFIASPSTIPNKYVDQYRSRTNESCVNAPILDANTKKMFDMAYAPDTDSLLYRAMNTPVEDHAGVAEKAYFQVCGADIMRDDGLIYAGILEDLGVDVKTDVYPGAPHVFWGIFAGSKLVGKWREDTEKAVGWLLGHGEAETSGKL